MSENKRFINEMIHLALPAAFQQVINLCVTLIDNLMVGSLGEASISAVSICGTFLWLVITFTNGLAGGAVIIAAQDYGNNNLERIKKLLSVIMTISLSIGLIFFVITTFFPVQILQIYSNVDSIIEPGVGYLKYIKYSFPILSLSYGIMIMMRSVRTVKIGLYSSMITCGFNVFFNWVFIYGHLGAPQMGAAGAALATSLTYFIQLIVVLTYVLKFEKNLKFKLSDFNPFIDKELFFKFIKLALPLLAIDIMYNFSSSAQTMITGRISENYVTANSIVHMAWSIPDMFTQGIALSASIIIGNAIGAKDYKKAKEDSKRFIVTSICFGLFMATSLNIILPFFIQFYHVTDATKLLARQMGYAASITVFFGASCAILSNGVLKSGGYTNRLLKIDTISIWCVAIPLGFIGAFVLNWPAPVLYLVLRSGNITKTFWSYIQLRKDNWIKNLT